jgi:hypothetical protein
LTTAVIGGFSPPNAGTAAREQLRMEVVEVGSVEVVAADKVCVGQDDHLLRE